MKNYYDAAVDLLNEAIKVVREAQEASEKDGCRLIEVRRYHKTEMDALRGMYQQARDEVIKAHTALNDVKQLSERLREKGYHVS